jgi:PAS domain S-box-containing protein
MSASLLLEQFQSGLLDSETLVRTHPEVAPRPLRRYIRELVWMTQAKPVNADDSLFRTAFDNAPIGMVYSDIMGRITRANLAFSGMLGYAPGDLSGMTVRQLLAPEPNDRETAEANALIAGRLTTSEREKSFIHRDGTHIRTLTAIAIVPDDQGAPSGAVAHILDLRELRELQQQLDLKVQALKASEERFEHLFRQAPQPLIMIDSKGLIVDSNQQAEHLFGWPADQLLGLSMSELAPDWASYDSMPLSSPFDTVTADVASETRRVRAWQQDGTPFTAAIRLARVNLRDAPVIVAGLTDVTAEDAAKAQLAINLDEKETLLKEIHHRVKNNLQMVSSLLHLQSSTLVDEDARMLVQECARRVQSMSLIHKQLYGRRSLSRIDFGAFAVELSESQRTAMAPELRLRIDTEPCTVPIQVALPMALILNELVTNGIKYGMRVAGGPVGRLDSAVDLHIRVREVTGKLQISVTDSGPGLPPDFDIQSASTLGTRLISSLARQVRAEVSFDVEGGTQAMVTCSTTDCSLR